MKKFLQLSAFLVLIAGIIKAQPTAFITANGATQFCQGGNVLLTANAGTGYSYQWQNTGVNINGATAISYSASLNGDYSCIVTDGTGSSSSNTIVVTVYPNPTPNLGPNTSMCQGNSVFLNAGGSYSCYIWSTGSVTQGINVTAGGVYTVTVCDNNGCTGSDDIAITVNPNPTPVITGNTSLCQGSSTVLAAGSGYIQYMWANGATTQSINVSTAGNYTVTVIDVNGCSGTASSAVSVYPLPTAAMSGNQNICLGSSTNITMSFTGNPPFVYTYTEGASVWGPFTTNNFNVNIPVSPLVTTVYTGISISDAHCTGLFVGSATVTVNPLPNVSITANGPTSFCNGDSVVLSANSGFVAYQWTKYNFLIAGATSQNFTAKHTGNYRCIATDLSGCPGTSPHIHVSVPCGPIIINNPNRAAINTDNSLKMSYVITDYLQLNISVKSYKLFDTRGILLNEKTDQASLDNFQLNFIPLKSGIYFLELHLNDPENSIVKIKVMKL